MTPRLAARHHHALGLVPATVLLMLASAPWGDAAAPTTVPTSQPAPLAAPSVPTKAIVAPASVARRGVVAPDDGLAVDGGVASTSPSASVSGIPDAALTAYQRAETVINAADRSCDISWQLIAAIGRVESDHGRVNGSALDDEGLATPGIVGIPLDGDNNTAVIRDTDAGQYDSDTRYDRAVGPMQFIPSTWSVVGVDGDNDGKRNPQDIDDAALASAVYLCSGDDDLATDAGRRAAVFRYNHSQDYVDLVLSFMDAYLDGDYTSVAAMTTDDSGSSVLARELVGPVAERTDRSDRVRSARDQDAGRLASSDRRDDAGKRAAGGDPGPEPGPTPGPVPGTAAGLPPTPSPVPSTTPQPDVSPGPTPGTTPGPTPEPPPASESPASELPASEPPASEPPASEPPAVTQEEATAQCLVDVGAPAADSAALEASGQLADFTICMTELGFPEWATP